MSLRALVEWCILPPPRIFMQVYNNVSALMVWNRYTANVDTLRRSMSRLASGLRIRTGGDDPAGLAMSERLRAQHRNSAAAASNVENKINYLQTADAWLQKIHDTLGRMAELAVMANDSAKSRIDRENLQNEFTHLQREIQRITSGSTAASKFNGLYLFRGGVGVAGMWNDTVIGAPTRGAGDITILSHDGAAVPSASWSAAYNETTQLWTVRNETTDVDFGAIAAAPSSGGSAVIGGTNGFQLTIANPKKGTYGTGDRITWDTYAYSPPVMGTTQLTPQPIAGNAIMDALGNGQGIADADWRALYDDAAQQWTIHNLTTGIDVGVIAAAPNAGGSIHLEGPNGTSFTIHAPTTGVYQTGDRFTWTNQSYVPAILGAPAFAETSPGTAGIAANGMAGDGSGVTAANWRALYDEGTHQWTIRNLTIGIDLGVIAAAPNEGGSIGLEGPNGTTFTIHAPTAGVYQTGDQFTWANTAYTPPTLSSLAFSDGPLAASAMNIRQGFGDGVTTANWRATYDVAASLWTVRNMTLSIDAGTLNTGPTAGGSLTNIDGLDGFTLVIGAPTEGSYNTGDRYDWTSVAHRAAYATTPNYTDARTLSVTLQIGPDSNQVFAEQPIDLEADYFGIIGSFVTCSYGTVNMTLLATAHHNVTWGSLISPTCIRIAEPSLAQAAVDRLNIGIDYISSTRAIVGAEMKRMEHTLSGLRSYEENTRASESRIRDVDVAQETTQLARAQILSQIGIAILAQVNALPEGVLQLVG